MARTPPSDVRLALVERAARMLAAREPVTLRALVRDTGTSTMAVYTHFGGMPGLWSAVRQEGFTRLAGHLAAVPTTDDPIRDLTASGAGYVANALTDPALFRAMFDVPDHLEDPGAAAATFQVLVDGVNRARAAGRFAETCDARALATQFWAVGHGLSMLVLSGVLSRSALDDHGPAMAVALFAAAGDDLGRCTRSVGAGWSTVRQPPGSGIPSAG